MLHIMKIDAIIGERTNAEIERAINKAQLVGDKLWHGDLSKEDLLELLRGADHREAFSG